MLTDREAAEALADIAEEMIQFREFGRAHSLLHAAHQLAPQDDRIVHLMVQVGLLCGRPIVIDDTAIGDDRATRLLQALSAAAQGRVREARRIFAGLPDA